MAKKVLLIAPVLTNSGYGVHSRQVVKYLFSLLDSGMEFSLDIWPIGCGPTPYIVNKTDPFIKRIYDHVQRRSFEYDITIQIQMPSPQEWNPTIAPINIGITAGIETDLCHISWLNTINQMNEVIVPSEFSKKTFVKSSEIYGVELQTPISVVREYISPIYFEENNNKEILNDIKTDFNFFTFGQLTGQDKDRDRKNLFTTIQAFFAAFRNNPNVGLIVKTNMGRETLLDMHFVKQILRQIKEGTCDVTNGQDVQPKIYCLHGLMNEQELRAIYKSPKVKALITSTRGEAVGLPIVEAAACGLPVIATDKGGHVEYLENKKWIGIPSELTQIPESKADEHVFHKQAKWFEVNPKNLVEVYQRFYENNSKPKEWALSMSKNIKEKYNEFEINKQYDLVLRKYLA